MKIRIPRQNPCTCEAYPFCEHATNATPQPDLVAQWYTMLPTNEAKAIIGNMAGVMEYGQLRSWNMLNENVRMILRREYRRITSKSE